MHSNNEKSGRPEDNCLGLAVFTFLFAWATIFELPVTAPLPQNFSALSLNNLTKLVFVFLCIWAILKPSSLFRSIPFFAYTLLAIVMTLPLVPNHIFVQIIILTTILACFIYSIIKERSNFTKTKFYELFASVLRLELIIIYFWAAFHKLNTGFLNYRISCATVQIFNFKDMIPFFPTPDWFIYINPYLTLLIEGLIPILLIIPKTRIYGLILGFCFHFILGFLYTSFTIFIYSLFSLFIPSSSYDKIKTKVVELMDRIWEALPVISSYKHWKKTMFGNITINVVLVLLIFFILRVFKAGGQRTLLPVSVGGLYLIFCIFLGITFIYFVVRRLKALRIDERLVFIPQKKWLLIFPAIVFLNGLLPYIGLKNIQVFAMFSNLQTEGGKTNHLLIPSSFQLFNNLEDLISIKRSNNKGLNQLSQGVFRKIKRVTTVLIPKSYFEYMKEKNEDFKIRLKYKIPFVMLQNIVTRGTQLGVKNIELEYERGGETFYTKNAELDPLLSNASSFQIIFLSQRAVPEDERGLCMW